MKSPSGRGNDSRRRTTALPFLRCDGSIRLSDGRSNLIGCGCLHLFLLPSPLLLTDGGAEKRTQTRSGAARLRRTHLLDAWLPTSPKSENEIVIGSMAQFDLAAPAGAILTRI
jgi:hypothetical protein